MKKLQGDSTKPVQLVILLNCFNTDDWWLHLLSHTAPTTTNLTLVKLCHPHLCHELSPGWRGFLCPLSPIEVLTECRRLTQKAILILRAQYITRKSQKCITAIQNIVSFSAILHTKKSFHTTEINAFYRRLSTSAFTAHILKNGAVLYNANQISN